MAIEQGLWEVKKIETLPVYVRCKNGQNMFIVSSFIVTGRIIVFLCVINLCDIIGDCFTPHMSPITPPPLTHKDPVILDVNVSETFNTTSR